MSKDVTLILAYGPNGEIGFQGGLPWPHHAEDMRRFKEETLGQTVIMGRKTYASLGSPLPWRNNVVITSKPSQVKGDVAVARSLLEAFDKVEEGGCFVIGGANVYEQAIPHANRILLTEMHGSFEADVYFKIPFIHHWTEISREQWRGEAGDCDFVELRML